MNKIGDKVKRKRGKNFTELEIRFLVDVAIRHIAIIENKKTDSVTWSEKENSWQTISKQFTALAGTERSAAVLKTKYEAIKHGIKRKLTNNKLQIFKTGGGSAEIDKLKDYEEKLSGYICLNTEGLPSEFDCDMLQTNSQIEGKAVNLLVK